jgi:hypothetical protein
MKLRLKLTDRVIPDYVRKEVVIPDPDDFEEAEEPDELLQMWTSGFTREDASSHLSDVQGVGPIARPASEDGTPDDPQLPYDVTALSYEELGTLYGRFVGMASYFEGEVALADIDAVEAESFLEHVRAKVRLRKAGTVADKDAKTANDREFIEAEMTSLKFTARAKLLKARLRGYEKAAAGLSREMSRRTGIPV